MSALLSHGLRSYVQPAASADLTSLTSVDVKAGYILYLPFKDEVMGSLAEHGSRSAEPVVNLTFGSHGADDGFYNHPILVISRPADAPHIIHFLFLTTFGGQKLEKRFKTAGLRREWYNYLAISPAPDHPLLEAGNMMYPTLSLREGANMRKRGYAKISEVYAMDWRGAQPCWGDNKSRVVQRRILDNESLTAALLLVQKVSGYKPGQQYDENVPRTTHLHVPPIGLASSLATVVGPRAATEGRTVSLIPTELTAREPSNIAAAMVPDRPSRGQRDNKVNDQIIDETQPLLGNNRREASNDNNETPPGFLDKARAYSRNMYQFVIQSICFLVLRAKQTRDVLKACFKEAIFSFFGKCT